MIDAAPAHLFESNAPKVIHGNIVVKPRRTCVWNLSRLLEDTANPRWDAATGLAHRWSDLGDAGNRALRDGLDVGRALLRISLIGGRPWPGYAEAPPCLDPAT
jgi:hypothetical protein